MYDGWRWPSFAAGRDGDAHASPRAAGCPTVLRLSDETESSLSLADPDRIGGRRGPAAA